MYVSGVENLERSSCSEVCGKGVPLAHLFDLSINDVVDALKELGVEIPGVAHWATCLLYADNKAVPANSS